MEVPGHIGKLAFTRRRIPRRSRPFVLRLPEDRESLRRRKKTPHQPRARSGSREIELAPAEAYGGPALPHHRELRVPSGHMHVALGVRRVVARDHAAVVRGRVERPEPLLPQRHAPPCPRFQWTEIMLWAAGRRFAADTEMRSLLSTITDSQPHQALLLGHRLSIRALIAWYFS